jgi:hypothetical protein
MKKRQPPMKESQRPDSADFPKGTDSLLGRHELGKPTQEQRRLQRTWRRSGGAIRADLAGLLILAVMAGLILAGVL